MKNNVKHAIIGCGRVAPNHVYACNEYGTKIKYCYDLDKSKTETFAQKYEIEKVARSYGEILEDEEVTSISICTDHASHFSLALRAIKSKKHIVIEKPICLEIIAADRIIKESKKQKLVLCAISQHRYNALINQIKKYVDNDMFGQITMINATLNCFKEREYYENSSWRGTFGKEGGSTLINQGIHTLDLVIWMKGLPVSVKSFGTTIIFRNIIETEDNFVGIMKFEDGGLAILSSTNTSTDQWDSKIELIGTKGKITFSTGFPARLLNIQFQDTKVQDILQKKINRLEEKGNLPPTMNYYGTSHREQIADFFDVIEGKSVSLKMNPVEARNTLRVVKEFYKYK